MAKRVRIGAGAGYAGDRWDPAVELAEKGNLDYLAFECLAERTIAREHLARIKDPAAGFNPLLAERVRAVLPSCLENKVRILTNMGAANPEGAARRVCDIAEEDKLGPVTCAVVLGDDVRDVVGTMPSLKLLESGEPLESIIDRVASANAYLGADAILPALQTDAEVIVTGRVADPSLFLAPMMHALNWSYDDYERMAQGSLTGHLLECAGQVTGGYFADPGKKDVQGLDRLGFPFADVFEDGRSVIGKVDGSGGRVDRMTCAEQLLYEIHDPAHYITPDCVLDVTDVSFAEIAPDQVEALGATAQPRTDTYKVSVGYFDGYIGEGQMSYGGINAVERARLAGQVIVDRLKARGFSYDDWRTELIGMESLHGPARERPEPYEVRLRVVGRTNDRKTADAIGLETETLLTNGPAGGAGDFKATREIYAVQSVLLPRHHVTPRIDLVGRA